MAKNARGSGILRLPALVCAPKCRARSHEERLCGVNTSPQQLSYFSDRQVVEVAKSQCGAVLGRQALEHAPGL
jgi:hypothetical protein